VPIDKPSVGSTGWNVATDAAIDQLNALEGIGAACRLGAGPTEDPQILTNNDVTVISLDTVRFNQAPAIFDPDTLDSTITVARTGGYLVAWSVQMGSGAAGARYSSIGVNGQYGTVAEVGRIGSGDYHTSSGAVPLALTAGDVLRLCAYVNTDGVEVGSAQPFHTWLSLTFLGPGAA
jgi:hypothetical protein